ncbi:MAG: sodium:solute symporter, partial [Eudoraea sp.]
HKNLEIEKKMAQDQFSSAMDSNDQAATTEAKKEMLLIIEREKNNREAAKAMIRKADDVVETNDKDYVFIHFILNYLPKGLVGLLLAVILSAAMSSTASELNALGTITALDLYKRNKKDEFSPEHYLKVSKLFTLLWGIVAILIACVANLFDNLIQLVNIIGSIFYGNVLGIFLLAFFFRFVKGNAVFIAAIITQVAVILVWYLDWMSYLWLNAFGCALVILLAIVLESFDRLHKNPPIKTI